jgi:hypothetical protein
MVFRLEPRIELALSSLSDSTTHATVFQRGAGGRERPEPAAASVLARLWQGVVHRVVEERKRVELPMRRLAESPPRSYRAAVGADLREQSSPALRPGLRERGWLDESPVQTLVAPPSQGRPPSGTAAENGESAVPVARGTPQPGVPAVDLERLTDQVVRRIDHRIVAHRERSGRI